MKFIIKKRKLIPLLVLLLFGLLNIFNLSSGIAMHMQGEDATFYPDDDFPNQYGVFIPAPNMYTTMSIDASNQGEFVIMDWLGGEVAKETVDIPGNDITLAYPWYFDNYNMNSLTDNDYIDPWLVNWFNVSASDAENENLSPYTLNTVFNYYVMPEETELTVPLNQSFPVQIDLLISKTGPKILKLDWLIDNPNVNPLNYYNLISPSNKSMDLVPNPIRAKDVFGGTIFFYIPFVAHESGTYRLLLKASYPSKPAFLNLEFLDFTLTDLAVNEFTFGGDGDEFPSFQDQLDDEWDAEWFRIEGNEGDKYSLYIGYDYAIDTPFINIYYPCEHRYLGEFDIGPGNFDIYFPKTGYVYLSFIDEFGGGPYKSSLYLRKILEVEHDIGGNISTIKVSRDQRVAINFSIQNDSFVRFNYTQYGNGNAQLSSIGIDEGIIFEDSKKLNGFEILTPLKTIAVDGMDFYYYYFPNGTYQAIVKNEFADYDCVLQISSELVEYVNDDIPVNALTYPNLNPSQTLTLEFEQDDLYNELYEAKYVYLDITEPGQYILNTTIDATDYLQDLSQTMNPAAVVVYNFSAGTYHNWTEEALNPSKSFPAFSTDTAGEQSSDTLFIAYTEKWQNMEFNFSQVGVKENNLDLDFFTWDGFDFNNEFFPDDPTDDFTQNGTIVNDLEDIDYINWIKGADFNLSGINEDEFYWLAIRLTTSQDFSSLPFIQLLTLSNDPIFVPNLNINLALVGESSYDYSDFWEPTITQEPEFMFEDENFYGSKDTNLFETGNPYTIGFEEGLYKLLIIPEGDLNYTGPITIDFAIENYWPYRHQESYNITAISPEPNLYMWQINNYTASNNYTAMGYAHDNGTIYSYELITTYNDTESELSYGGSNSYFVIECFGKTYQWTQLVVSCNNVSAYELYLMQDLPWIDNTGPNGEVMNIPFSAVNSTYEFGVLTDHFFLLFEVDAFNDTVTFRIDLNQYNTTLIYGTEITASYTPPADSANGDNLVLILAITIPSVVGAAVVVVYVMKKKGRILTKTP